MESNELTGGSDTCCTDPVYPAHRCCGVDMFLQFGEHKNMPSSLYFCIFSLQWLPFTWPQICVLLCSVGLLLRVLCSRCVFMSVVLRDTEAWLCFASPERENIIMAVDLHPCLCLVFCLFVVCIFIFYLFSLFIGLSARGWHGEAVDRV